MENLSKTTKKIRKITKNRLKNIALYYMQRFDSSVDNLRQVLKRRVSDYAYANPEFDKNEAHAWIEELLQEFEGYGYLNDERYAESKVRGYLLSGKPEKYIKIKMQQKGVDSGLVDNILDVEEYDVEEMALRHAKKKKLGPFMANLELRKEKRQKDLAAMIRAGFDYETAQKVIDKDVDYTSNDDF